MTHTFSTSRLEAFSDGVIAVIITIMVLDLKIPRLDGPGGFHEVIPTLGVYALSFAFVGIYWVNHHMLVHGIREASPRVLWANLIWLFCLSLVPYFTDYVHDKSMSSFSVAMYAGSLTLTGFGFMLLRITIDARRRAEGTFKHTDLALRLKHRGSLAIYIICVPLAYTHPKLALCLIGMVTLMWVIPTLGVERCEPSDPLASAQK
jgi:uncharacterized membrane protein